MQKIMFNNTYGLTDSVKKGIKTATTRFEPRLDGVEKGDFLVVPRQGKIVIYGEKGTPIETIPLKYKVGEVVAVAESYKDLGYSPTTIQRGRCVRKSIHGDNPGWTENMIGQIGDWYIDQLAGWDNKMFVHPSMCNLKIGITNIKAERLQNISDEDCLAEGVLKYRCIIGFAGEYVIKDNNKPLLFHTPHEAFADLIDKVSGKGTWKRNPWAIRYYFELVD